MADDVSSGSHYTNVSTDWALTWNVDCARDVMMTSSLSGSVLWVGSSGIRVWSAIQANKTHGLRVARICARGQQPRRRVTVREDDSKVRFRRRFHQWLHLFLLYTVVWSKHNFDNFHF
jgi:hypothetical protein